ncbi:MAG: hypothetical protein J5833_05765 [Victivallales bacterium]|nr:hypothetical protein [Victivallales bacterium]
MLDELIDGRPEGEATSEVVWVALYERMLGNYQKTRLDQAFRDGELFLKLRGDRQDMTPWAREFFVLFGDVQAARRRWTAASQLYLKLELLGKTEPMDAMMQYAMYEAASCLFMNNEPAAADDILKKHFEGKTGLDTHFLYESAMLQGKCRQANGDFEGARQCFERAQAVFGQSDTYKSSLAKCRQGEMLLMEAEAELNKQKNADRASAMKQLSRASEIFYNLLEPKDGTAASTAAGKDHCFDLYLRAQFELGECYENMMDGENVSNEARESALWCYRRIGDYFVAKFRDGDRVRSSRYYVRSIERRVSLLMGGVEPPSNDVLDTVARLYEEYSRMALPGSVMAARRAEELRKRLK